MPIGLGTMPPVLLTPAGSLGLEGAAELAKAARAALAEGGPVRLSLAETTELSGAAAQVIVATDKSLRRRGERLDIHDVPPNLATLLTWCGLDFSSGA